MCPTVAAATSYFNAASMATAGSRDICWYYQASSQDNVEAMTQDGHGGMWLTADASIEPGR